MGREADVDGEANVSNRFTTQARTFPCALEEEAHHEDLQASHRHHHQALDYAKVEDPALGTTNGAEVAVFTGAEVFLVARNGRQLGGQLEDGLLQSRGLFGGGALSGGELCAFFVLDLVARGKESSTSGPGKNRFLFACHQGSLTYRDLEVYQLLRKRRHLIVEAEPVFSHTLSRKNEIALTFLRSVQDHLITRTDNGVIDIERTARLDLREGN